MKTFNTQFKVVTVSRNTNSFGLHGVIIVDKSGLSFEVGISGWCCPKQGNVITGSITENENLHLLDGISFEIPRKLPKMPPETVKDVFAFVPIEKNKVKQTKLVNVAKGKKINTTLDFAKVFGGLDVDKKMAVIKNVESTLASGVSPRGTKLVVEERAATEQLLRWCGVNLLVGNELCPPENLNQY